MYCMLDVHVSEAKSQTSWIFVGRLLEGMKQFWGGIRDVCYYHTINVIMWSSNRI